MMIVLGNLYAHLSLVLVFIVVVCIALSLQHGEQQYARRTLTSRWLWRQAFLSQLLQIGVLPSWAATNCLILTRGKKTNRQLPFLWPHAPHLRAGGRFAKAGARQ